MRIGAQLYTIRDYIQSERALEFSFEKVAKMGYEFVQLSGATNYNAKTVRQIADKNNLKIVLTHNPQDALLKEPDRIIEENAILGAKYLGIGGMPGVYSDRVFIEAFANDYIPVAEKIKSAGQYFMYHNHDSEFSKFPNSDKTMLETLMEIMPADLMGFTLDLFWVQAAGADPVVWLEKLKDRIPCIHLKDMAMRGRERLMAPIYEGNMNYDAILKKLEENGTTEYALVEQDTCQSSPFDCLETSCKNLIKNGWK